MVLKEDTVSGVSGDHTDFCWAGAIGEADAFAGFRGKCGCDEGSMGVGLASYLEAMLASSDEKARPMTMGLSSGDSLLSGVRADCAGRAEGWGDAVAGLWSLLFLNQFQFPTEAEVGSPSNAFRAAASTNFPARSTGVGM